MLARRRAARSYIQATGSVGGHAARTPGSRHVFHLYVIRSSRRDDLLTHLQEKGVGAGIHYPVPLHRQPAYADGYRALTLPATEAAAAEVVSLPVYPEI